MFSILHIRSNFRVGNNFRKYKSFANKFSSAKQLLALIEFSEIESWIHWTDWPIENKLLRRKTDKPTHLIFWHQCQSGLSNALYLYLFFYSCFVSLLLFHLLFPFQIFWFSFFPFVHFVFSCLL